MIELIALGSFSHVLTEQPSFLEKDEAVFLFLNKTTLVCSQGMHGDVRTLLSRTKVLGCKDVRGILISPFLTGRRTNSWKKCCTVCIRDFKLALLVCIY